MAANDRPGPAAEAIDPNWLHWKVRRSDPQCVSQYCPDRPYLEFVVPAQIVRIRRIVFTTVSHDQGFSDSGGDAKGTYEGTFSWIEAVVTAPSGHDRIDRRRMQYNLHAVDTPKKHVNTWDDQRSKEDIQTFLRAIQPLDTIAIMPKTRHVGWLNYFYEAEMEIWGEEEDPATKHAIGLTQKVRSLKLDSAQPDGGSTEIYRPFTSGADEIRLISIQPGVFDDEIVCEIHYARLSDPEMPTYEALSYCWGNPNQVGSITVLNDKETKETVQEATLLVTSSLCDALRYLRRDDGKPLILWADAICINQDNTAERSAQVQLIPRIYTQARHIVIWLGKATEGAADTIIKAEKFTKRYEQADDHPKSYDHVQRLHKPVLDDGSLLVDSPLFEYDYFHRTWVLQEVFNAKSVSVHCGAHTIGWAPILRLNDCLIKSMLIPNPVGKHTLPALFAGLFEITEGGSKPLKLGYKRLPVRLGILDVLIRGLDLEATDTRDKLFALLTFGEETCNLDHLPSMIKPDYSKLTPQVFADFTRWWIASHKSLRILSAAQLSIGRTWQPMTTNLAFLEELERATWSMWHTGKSFYQRGTLGLMDDCSYSASAGTEPDVTLLSSADDPLVLTLKGHTVATIQTIDHYPFYPMYLHAQDCEAASCAHCAIHAAYVQLFDPTDERGTWRYGAQHDSPQLTAARRSNSPDVAYMKLIDHFKAHLQLVQETGAIECHGRPFFATRGGKRGLAPPAAKEGDYVVVFHGGQVPYLLRAKGGDDFYFIGECYLEDYMYGQALGDAFGDDGALETQIFNLV